MSLLSLPVELLFLILNILDQKDILELVCTSRALSNTLQGHLYTHDIQYRGGDGLIWAAIHRHTAIIKCLINNGADLDIKVTKMGDMPYIPRHLYRDEYDNDGWLVAHNPDCTLWKPFKPRSEGRYDWRGIYLNMTPLTAALEHKQVNVAELLLGCDAVDIGLRSFSNQTPLHLAAKDGHERVVELILARHDASVNAQDRNGETALHLAVKEGRMTIAQLLLARGDININSANGNGDVALHLAAWAGYEEIVKLILDRPDCDGRRKNRSLETPFHVAVKSGHTSIVQLLILSGLAEHTAVLYSKNSPLYTAAQQGNQSTVRLLLNQDHLYRQTMDMFWMTQYKPGIPELLLEGVLKKTLRFIHPEYSLEQAASEGSVMGMKLLLAHDGVNPDRKNENGMTPLAIASQKGHIPVMRLLLAMDQVDVNSRDEGGNTPLFYAAEVGRDAVDVLLSQRGVIRYPVNKTKETPAHYALVTGNRSLARFLQGKKKFNRELEILLQNV